MNVVCVFTITMKITRYPDSVFNVDCFPESSKSIFCGLTVKSVKKRDRLSDNVSYHTNGVVKFGMITKTSVVVTVASEKTLEHRQKNRKR